MVFSTTRASAFFPLSRGVSRVDDKRVLSGIIFINRNGLRWRDAAAEYGPHKTLYNRWFRWSQIGVFAQILQELVRQDAETEMIMIDAIHLKAHRTALSLRKKGSKRLIGQIRGGMNSKLHVVCDSKWRPIQMYPSAGQTSNYVGAAGLLRHLPQVKCLLTDRGYDATGSVVH
jgi:transposase